MQDPDLEIRGAGGGGDAGRSFRPLDKGGPSLQKKLFWPFGPQYGLKITWGEAGSDAATSDKQISGIFQRQITIFND